MAFFGGLHFWWPKITGRLFPETLGRVTAVTIFVGFNLTFFPQFIVGYLGMPRRYHVYPEEFQLLHILSTGGASVLALGYMLMAVYLVYSLVLGPKSPANPWKASGLEWRTPSPPPTENFDTPPVVDYEAYAYTDESVYRDDSDSGESGNG